MGSKATLSDIISANKNFHFDKKISFRRNNRQLTSYFLSEKGCQYILEKIRASFILGLYNAGLYLAFTSIFTSLRRF